MPPRPIGRGDAYRSGNSSVSFATTGLVAAPRRVETPRITATACPPHQPCLPNDIRVFAVRPALPSTFRRGSRLLRTVDEAVPAAMVGAADVPPRVERRERGPRSETGPTTRRVSGVGMSNAGSRGGPELDLERVSPSFSHDFSSLGRGLDRRPSGGPSAALGRG